MCLYLNFPSHAFFVLEYSGFVDEYCDVFSMRLISAIPFINFDACTKMRSEFGLRQYLCTVGFWNLYHILCSSFSLEKWYVCMVHYTNRKEIGPQLEMSYLSENSVFLGGALQKRWTLH